MIRFLLVPCLAILLAFVPLFAAPPPALADGCFICTRGSSCGQYCRYSGKADWKNRKKCIKAGCKIGGTRSCPTAANVKICAGANLIDLKPKHASRGRQRASQTLITPGFRK